MSNVEVNKKKRNWVPDKGVLGSSLRYEGLNIFERLLVPEDRKDIRISDNQGAGNQSIRISGE